MTSVDHSFDHAELQRWLEECGRVSVLDSGRVTGHYYDTFDWRLYQAGLSLLVEQQGRWQRWYLLDRHNGHQLAELEWSQLPALEESLPPGELGERLRSLMEMRRLLPLCKLQGVRSRVAVLNEDEKIVVRLAVLESRVVKAGETLSLPLQIRVSALKGYETEADQVTQRLSDLRRDSLDDLDAALAAVGRRGCDYSSKLNIQLDPYERADAAAKQIQLHLLDTLGRNVDGVCQDLDSEFLHDLRVAVRRSRSALTQIQQVFDPEIVDRFKEDLAWIGQISGPTRDMDVYLLSIPSYLEALPPAYRDALAPFRRYLLEQRAREQRKLAAALDSQRFKVILDDWRAFLERTVPQVATPSNAVRPVLEVADRRIYKMFKQVLSEGKAIHDASAAEELHELRKSCKKLRYLLEFFQSLYPLEEIRLLVRALKELLDNLGAFQDLEIQAQQLERIADELRRNRVKTHTLIALGMLIDGLFRRQREARAQFSLCFAEFAHKENRARFKRLFKWREGEGA